LLNHIGAIKEQGFIGIKMHPYYQNFFLAEDRMTKVYTALIEHDLLLGMHTGFDIAYPRLRRAAPDQILRVLNNHPRLQLITTHLGGWDDWNEVERVLIGRPVYIDISFSLPFLSQDKARRLITGHASEYLLFGTDSPWADQRQCLEQLQALELDSALFNKIVCDNALKLLEGAGI
jgi:predicted TIM-barrel fold metal-dependent hydrolase